MVIIQQHQQQEQQCSGSSLAVPYRIVVRQIVRRSLFGRIPYFVAFPTLFKNNEPLGTSMGLHFQPCAL